MENWVIKNKKADFKEITEKCGVSEVLARCLVNRGYESKEEIVRFLEPSLDDLHSPMLLKDMMKACEILEDKAAGGQYIRIIGDYDVDGVISTYILYRGLKAVGAKVDYEIPDRIKDGYGINIRIVEQAYADGIDTLLTCDNGIVAMEQTARAKELGMTVIITDHHNLAESEDGVILPPADAIVNSKRPDCEYPFKGLCGAAIVYKLIAALLYRMDAAGKEALEEELLAYTAIATVCDVMDLVDENRAIVRFGLDLLKNTKNYGLQALMELSGIERNQLNVFHLGFVIGPCLNASGRLDTAKKGLELLLADNGEDACRIADQVRQLNEVRKEMTAENVLKAIEKIEASSILGDTVLVVFLEDCHESIAGIIAGRIKEKYHRPTIILTKAEEGVKGSARSIPGYNIIEELVKHRELFTNVGGHPMAAGLSLSEDKVEELRRRLNANLNIDEEVLLPKVTIDIHLPFGYLSEPLVDELKRLEPFGKGNEKPLFAEKNLKIKSVFILGEKRSGLRFYLEDTYGKRMEAVYFGDVDGFFKYIADKYGEQAADNLKRGRGSDVPLAITYYPRINEYNNMKRLQLMIQNFR